MDEFWNKLLEGGTESQCGWLKDKFGVSWQIVPTVLIEMLQDRDAAKAKRVMKAMLGMKKLENWWLEAGIRATIIRAGRDKLKRERSVA